MAQISTYPIKIRAPDDFFLGTNSAGAVKRFKGLGTGLNIVDYGAVADGVTDNSAAIVDAIDAAGALSTGQTVFLPAGNFAIADYLTVPYSNVHLLGAGKGVTKVTFLNALSDHGFKFSSGGAITNCGISNMTIDAGSFVGSGAGVMLAEGVTNGFYCRDVEIINMAKAGIIVQGCTNFDISDNNITLNTAINTQNNGIICTATSQNTRGIVARNTCLHTNIELDGQYYMIEDNTITDWKYGGGIVMGPNAFTHDNIIRGNICHGSTGVDADVTYPAGLEIFSARCAISANICFNNSGNGIVVGGPKCIVTGNVCYDNGQSAHGGDVSGILLQDGGGAFIATDAIVTGNNCFNFAGVTQEYGIQVNSTVTGFIIWPNKLVGNNTAAHNAVQTVAALPSASGSGVGARAFVTNATVTTFNSVVAGGGGNSVGVISDGTNWRIG